MYRGFFILINRGIVTQKYFIKYRDFPSLPSGQ
jgi:hypothetical protein